jgi:hypothetical protein
MGRAQNITESDPSDLSETLAANLAAMHHRGHLFGACKDRGASSHCNRGRLTTLLPCFHTRPKPAVAPMRNSGVTAVSKRSSAFDLSEPKTVD